MITYDYLHKNIDFKEPAYPLGNNVQVFKNLAKRFSESIAETFPSSKIYLICTGSSGALIAGVMVHYANIKKIIYIYKDTEKHHGDNYHYLNHNAVDPGIFIFVDDLIDSGETIQRVINKLNKFQVTLDAIMVGGVVYLGSAFCEIDVHIKHIFAQNILL